MPEFRVNIDEGFVASNIAIYTAVLVSIYHFIYLYKRERGKRESRERERKRKGVKKRVRVREKHYLKDLNNGFRRERKGKKRKVDPFVHGGVISRNA